MPDLFTMTPAERVTVCKAHAQANGRTFAAVEPVTSGLWLHYTDAAGKAHMVTDDAAWRLLYPKTPGRIPECMQEDHLTRRDEEE